MVRTIRLLIRAIGALSSNTLHGAAALALVFTGACTHGTPTGAEEQDAAVCPTDTAAIQRQILRPTCGVSGCHQGDEPMAGLDLASGELEKRIYARSASCGRPIVVAGDPDRSLLFEKISTDTPSCGVRMPNGGPPLGTHQIECIRGWIASLPKQGGPVTDAATEGLLDGATAATDASLGGDGGGSVAAPDPICPDDQMPCNGSCVPAIPPTLDDIHFRILKRNCVNASCHGAVNPPEHLDLSTPDAAYANLVGVPSRQRPELDRVKPGHPEQSYLIDKLLGVDMAARNSADTADAQRMPLGNAPLCSGRIDVIERWIRDGAAR